MITRQLKDEVITRVNYARTVRCSAGPWIEPPQSWPEIVQSAWPSMWFLAPHKVPSGWCDIILAMTEHVAKIDPGARFHDAYENVLSGELGIRVGYSVDGVHDIVDAYEWISLRTCRVCGSPAIVREEGRKAGADWIAKPPQVRCDEHA